MEGVSGRAIEFAIEGAALMGVDPGSLFEGLDLPETESRSMSGAMAGAEPGARTPSRSSRVVTSANERLDWSTFVTLTRRLGEAVGGPDGLRDLGRRTATSRSFALFELAGRALTHPADLYYMGARWMGPTLFPMIRGAVVELPDGRLQQTLTLAPGFEDCPELFHVMHGAFAEMPRSWGHAASVVDLQLRPSIAVYTIRVQSERRGWLGRAIRAVHRRVAFRSLLTELEEQQAAIQSSYWEMLEARDRIAAQADELEKINRIGRSLSEQINLDALIERLFDLLRVELSCSAIEIELDPRENDPSEENEPEPAVASKFASTSNTPEAPNEIEPDPAQARPMSTRVHRREGDTRSEPARRYSLQAGERSLGTLAVWQSAEDHAAASTPLALLERLVPWISIAVENARTYEQLEAHAEELQHRVRERTARLLAANHHLVREIDERKRATDALLESEAQLRASERLASVGTLAAGIAHEINNPIGSILAAAQFAQIVEASAAEEPGNEESDSRASAVADSSPEDRESPGNTSDNTSDSTSDSTSANTSGTASHSPTKGVQEARPVSTHRSGTGKTTAPQDRADRAETTRAALADIVLQARRCGDIVRSVLQFSRDERTEKWDCRLDDILRRSTRLTDGTASEFNATVHLVLADRPIWVHVNPIQIEQAIVNLVRNALEAGSQKVLLEVEEQREERLALIAVVDDGPGIPQDERTRIFEPFYTTRRDEGGTGLGLSVVHGIAAEHLGSLKIESSESGGVAALLELPTIPAPAVAYGEKPDESETPPGS